MGSVVVGSVGSLISGHGSAVATLATGSASLGKGNSSDSTSERNDAPVKLWTGVGLTIK